MGFGCKGGKQKRGLYFEIPLFKEKAPDRLNNVSTLEKAVTLICEQMIAGQILPLDAG